MKRIISFILTAAMLMSYTTVFAENPLTSNENSVTINTGTLSDENVLYQAMQSDNGIALLSLDDEEDVQQTNNDVNTDFDVVFNFDMSSSMYEYDINGEMAWLEYFGNISEEAPENTRYAIVSSDDNGFSDDLSVLITEQEDKSYSGEYDVISALDECIDVFDSESGERNKVVIVTTHEVSDADELEDKLYELRSCGVIPFVFVLNTTEDTSLDIYGVYPCSSDLQLRVAISDLYLSFAEFSAAVESSAETYAISAVSEDETADTSTNEVTSTSYTYETDFRSIHEFDSSTIDTTSAGVLLAEVLSIYGCVPIWAENGGTEYKMSDFSTEDLQYFLKGNNKKFSESDNATLDDFETVWNSLFDDISGIENFWITDSESIEDVIEKNLKRRFPMIGLSDGTYSIISGSSDTTYTAVFDTYEYIMCVLIYNGIITDSAEIDGTTINITVKYPASYELSKDKYQISPEPQPTPTINEHVLTMELSDNDDVILSNKVEYSNGIGDLCNPDKRYIARLYNDITSTHVWYYDYVFEATNRGIVTGYEDGSFKPAPTEDSSNSTDGNVTRGEFIKMILSAVGYDLDVVDDKVWAQNYLQKANDMGLLLDYDYSEAIDEDTRCKYQDKLLTRYEATYIMTQLFIKNDATSEEKLPLVASVLYEYTMPEDYNELSNIFTDVTDIKGIYTDSNILQKIYESIFQMYSNGIIVGYGDGTFLPTKEITRAESCKLIIKSLFTLEEPELIDINIYNEDYSRIEVGDTRQGNLDDAGQSIYYADIDWDGLYSIYIDDNDNDDNTDNVQYTLYVDDVQVDIKSTYEFTAGQTLKIVLSGNANAEYTLTFDDAKMVYITLYDSIGGSDEDSSENSIFGKPRYCDENGKRFTYDVEFFENYMELTKDVNVNFVISIRDLDFGGNYNNVTIDYESKMLDSDIYSIYSDDAEYINNKIFQYVKDIIENIVTAYNNADEEHRPEYFPRITIGTPHFEDLGIEYLSDEKLRDDIIQLYLDITKYLYTEVVNLTDDPDISLPYEAIWGMYYGKEDPVDTSSTQYKYLYDNMQNVSTYIHENGKRMLWAPYTVCDTANLERIGNVANSSMDGLGNDLCDVVMIQPGYYYYEINSNEEADDEQEEEQEESKEQSVITFIEGDLKTSFENNCVYISGSPVGGEKTTKTKIILEVEYDASIFTGRVSNGKESNIIDKVNRFLKTIDTYTKIIHDDRTSFGTYSGGPNEQDYKNIVITQDETRDNYNKHSNRNYSSLLEESGEVMYYEFYGYLITEYLYYSTYNSNILFDITKGILYNEWSDDILQYLNNGVYEIIDEDTKEVIASGEVELKNEK